MNEKELSPASVIKRLESMEQELREIRQYLIQNATPENVQNSHSSFDIDYTLDDLYAAMGGKHHYAVRLKNALARKNVFTMAQFLALTPGQLLDMDNVGSGTLERIKKALDKLGIKW